MASPRYGLVLFFPFEDYGIVGVGGLGGHLKTDDRAKDLPNAGERKLVSFAKRIKKRGAVVIDCTPLGYWVL